MTGITLESHIDNRPALERLNALTHLNTTPLVRDISEYMLERVLDHFETETKPDGEKFQPSQRVLKHGGKTLQVKGILRDSYTYNILSPVSAELGSGLVYAAIHHFGGIVKHEAHDQTLYFRRERDGAVGKKFVKKHQSNFTQKASVGEYEIVMPARPVLGMSSADETRIDEIVLKFFKEAA